MNKSLPDDFIEMCDIGNKYSMQLTSSDFSRYVFGKLDQLNEEIFKRSLSCCIKEFPIGVENKTAIGVKKESLWNRFLDYLKI